MSFDTLGLSPALLKAIDKKGYSKPSPVQEKAIPLILERKDVLASAQTGTGKTAGFTLPVLQILSQGKELRKKPIRALVLTPTRELAAQVSDNVKTYSEYLNIRSTVIFGGVNQRPQVSALKKGVDILIATPGRLLDLHSQKLLSLSKVEILILDEADRMLDMGFLKDIRKILNLIPEKRQNLLFSATFSKEIKQLAGQFMHHPVSVKTAPENTTAETVNQTFYHIDQSKKVTLLTQLINDGNWEQVLIFTKTKHGANRLSEKLNKRNISAAAIHGNKSQNARTKALEAFKKNEIRILVATDIAARGLDIPLLPYVINYELPNISEDYVHRIGRTGRAGARGKAISLVSIDEKPFIKGIEKLIARKIDLKIFSGFEPTDQPKPKQKKGGPKSKQFGKRRFNRKGRNSRKKV